MPNSPDPNRENEEEASSLSAVLLHFVPRGGIEPHGVLSAAETHASGLARELGARPRQSLGFLGFGTVGGVLMNPQTIQCIHFGSSGAPHELHLRLGPTPTGSST